MALLDDVKVSLRMTSTAYDSEINDLILAAKRDLYTAGVKATITETDPLFKRAVAVYVKLHFGSDNKDFERLHLSYTELLRKLGIVGDYIDT